MEKETRWWLNIGITLKIERKGATNTTVFCRFLTNILVRVLISGRSSLFPPSLPFPAAVPFCRTATVRHFHPEAVPDRPAVARSLPRTPRRRSWAQQRSRSWLPSAMRQVSKTSIAVKDYEITVPRKLKHNLLIVCSLLGTVLYPLRLKTAHPSGWLRMSRRKSIRENLNHKTRKWSGVDWTDRVLIISGSSLKQLTLSLLRVINVKFLLQPHQKYYITQ